MALQSSSAEPIDRLMVHEPLALPIARGETDLPEHDRPMAPARGIILAVLLSFPVWALVVFALYKLL
jgi:hypothetical protein